MSDDRIAKLEARVEHLEAVIRALGAVFGGGAAGAGADAASDRELDHPQYGDPEVKLVPRDWADKSIKGRKFSRCPAEFLDVLAESFDYFAAKNAATGEKTSNGRFKADFDRRSARLARGWARRLRAGWTPPPAPERPTFGGGAPGFGSGAPAFGGGGSFGGGNSFGGASNGSRGFLGGAPPAAPLPSAADPEPSDDPTDFPFGANAPSTSPTADDADDDLPLPL